MLKPIREELGELRKTQLTQGQDTSHIKEHVTQLSGLIEAVIAQNEQQQEELLEGERAAWATEKASLEKRIEDGKLLTRLRSNWAPVLAFVAGLVTVADKVAHYLGWLK